MVQKGGNRLVYPTLTSLGLRLKWVVLNVENLGRIFSSLCLWEIWICIRMKSSFVFLGGYMLLGVSHWRYKKAVLLFRALSYVISFKSFTFSLEQSYVCPKFVHVIFHENFYNQINILVANKILRF